MPIRDLLTSAVSRPAGKVVEAPVREMIRQAIREADLPSANDLRALRDELAGLKKDVAAIKAKVEGASPAEARLGALEAQAERLAELAGRIDEDSRKLFQDLERSLAASAAGRGQPKVPEASKCKVVGCGAKASANGFCTTHDGKWTAGRLAGFVSPEGQVEIDGVLHDVGASTAGEPFEVVGKGKQRKVKVKGESITPKAIG